MTKSTKRVLLGAATGLTLGLIGATAQAQVFTTDVIVQGSVCAGFDCANGESFGFDTLRLKENNLRLHFDDTSASASFSANDWRIVANDTANGGASYLAFEDSTAGRIPFRVEAGAITNALYVDDGGRVGFGTDSPVVDLHAVGGNSPTLRLEQNGSSGFTPQTFDIAANEANFFIRDVTNGSALVFRIQPGAGSNSIYIRNNNDVGLGTAAPAASLHVKRTGANASNVLIEAATGDASFELKQVGTVAAQWEFRNQAGSGRLNVGLVGGNTPLKIDSAAANNLLKLGINSNPSAVVVTGQLLVNNTAMNVPDYVFDESYQLMPLTELHAFIEANNHLPRIPSAAEVKRDGLNLTDMQLALLEKVEELTLYTLEQQRTIDAMQLKLEDLQK